MTGSFLMEIINGLSFVLNLVEFEWVILTEKMLAGESIDYIVIKSGDYVGNYLI